MFLWLYLTSKCMKNQFSKSYMYLTLKRNTVYSKIIVCIYHCDLGRIDENVRLVIAISGKSAYRYKHQISEYEFLLLCFSSTRIIHINKNLAIISEFTVLQLLCDQNLI